MNTVNKKGFMTPMAMLFAVGVGMYIITIGISLNSASHKVVQHNNLSKFAHAMSFFEQMNTLTKEGPYKYFQDIEPSGSIQIGDLWYDTANGNQMSKYENIDSKNKDWVLKSNIMDNIDNKGAIDLLFNKMKQSGMSLVNKANVDSNNKSDTLNITPAISITVPARNNNKKQFSDIFISFSKKSSCNNSLMSLKKHSILGFATGKNTTPQGIDIETSANWFDSDGWTVFGDVGENTSSTASIPDLCSRINNDKLWVHYEI